MSYTNDENQVINISEMSASQEREFIEAFERFGSTDRAENEAILSVEDFAPESTYPSENRLFLNIDSAYEFECADKKTIKAARDAFTRGWQK